MCVAAAAAAASQEGGNISLEPEERAEIKVSVQPMVTGNSSWLVSLVDPGATPSTQLLRRLLLTAAVPNPNVARTYEAALVRAIALLTEALHDAHGVHCRAPCTPLTDSVTYTTLLLLVLLVGFLVTVLYEGKEDADHVHKSLP